MGHFGRRRFVTALGATALANPLVGLAQSASKVPRIGMLLQDSANSSWTHTRRRQLHKFLADVGYKVGENIQLEWRSAEGKIERLPALADELVRLKVDVIVPFASEHATHAAARATRTIPIVMYAYADDPIKQGIVASLARPGGNVTGTRAYVDLTDLALKRAEILKLGVPSAVRVAALWSPWTLNAEEIANEINDRIAKKFGIAITNFIVRKTEELPAALDQIAAFKPDALQISAIGAIRDRIEEVTKFAIHHKLVAVGNASPITVRKGALYFYGLDVPYALERTVSMIDRVLGGTKPGDLPVEQPQRFELIYNAKTAQAIGYTPPPAFRVRIDRTIQ